jgi:enamine deaminase RidA (YjgF/YER057c/UK114 family)
VQIERRLAELGHDLRPAPQLPAGVEVPFQWVRVLGDRCLVSGHGALAIDGQPEGPFGRVPDQVIPEEAQASAMSAMLAILGAVQREIGDLDRIVGFAALNGFVQAEPGYAYTTAVLNPVSEFLLDVFGDAGRHTRTAIGVAALPLNLPVVMSAECLIA